MAHVSDKQIIWEDKICFKSSESKEKSFDKPLIFQKQMCRAPWAVMMCPVCRFFEFHLVEYLQRTKDWIDAKDGNHCLV